MKICSLEQNKKGKDSPISTIQKQLLKCVSFCSFCFIFWNSRGVKTKIALNEVIYVQWLIFFFFAFSSYYFISFYYKISPVSKQLKEWYDEYPHMHHFIVSLIVLILSMYTCICIFHLLIDWLYHLKVAYKSFHLSPTKFKHLSPEKMTYFLDEQVLFDT